MNIRERILTETEAAAPFKKAEFMEAVSTKLIQRGEFVINVDPICPDDEYDVRRPNKIPARWVELVRVWVEEAGLTWQRWGERWYSITL